MKTTRKSALAALAALPLAIGLAACGGGGGDKPASGDEGGGDAAPAGNKLTVWTWDPAFNIYAMEEAGKIYKESHPDFELDVQEVPWADIQTRISTLAQSKETSELPDILLMQNNAAQLNLINYPDIFVPLSDGPIDFKNFPEGVQNYSIIDGVNYGVPFDSGTSVFAMRTDILEEAGYKIDDFKDITWDKFVEQAKQVLDKTGKPLMSIDRPGGDVIAQILQSSGHSMFDKDGNPVLDSDPAVKAAVEQYVELVQTGVLQEVSNWDEYVGSFTNGNVAGTMNGVWILASVQTAEDQAGKWEITDLPKVEGIDGATNYSANGGSSWMVTANADKALAEDFLASTFAGSEKLYDTILPSAGAVANWIPAGKSEVYKEPQAFFNNQPIYEMVVDFGAKVPSNNTGVYYYEARDAVSVAASEVLGGADIDKALKDAQDKVVFAMQ